MTGSYAFNDFNDWIFKICYVSDLPVAVDILHTYVIGISSL